MPKFRATIPIEVEIEADDLEAAFDKLNKEYPYNEAIFVQEIVEEK